MSTNPNSDTEVITLEDLAEALNGNFLNKMKEFAWRGKEAKLPDVPNEEMHSFQIWVGIVIEADATSDEPLTFDKLGGYRFQSSPFTKDDVKKSLQTPPTEEYESIQEEEIPNQ